MRWILPALSPLFLAVFYPSAPVRAEEPLRADIQRLVRQTGLRSTWFSFSTKDGCNHSFEVGPDGALVPRTGVENEEFAIGSNTKTMTALLYAQAFERGHLSPDMTLEQVARRIEAGDQKAGRRARPLEVHPELRQVTLKMLLSHNGGMPGSQSQGYLRPDVADRSGLLQELLKAGPKSKSRENGKPGYQFNYSDDGYAVLGEILERTSEPQRKYEKILEEEIFKPLGMKTCGLKPKHHPSRFAATRTSNVPACEIPTGDPMNEAIENWVFEFEPQILAPGASATCSLADWMKFERYLMNGLNGVPSGPGILKDPASFQKLEEVHDGHFYSVGGLMLSRKDSAAYHYGSNGGYYSIGWMQRTSGQESPHEALSVVAVSTQPYSQALFGKLYYLVEMIKKENSMIGK